MTYCFQDNPDKLALCVTGGGGGGYAVRVTPKHKNDSQTCQSIQRFVLETSERWRGRSKDAEIDHHKGVKKEL